MKKILVTAVMAMLGLGVYAQGQLDFNNSATTCVSNTIGGAFPANKVATTVSLVYGLFVGAQGSTYDQLTLKGTTTSSTTSAGRLNSGGTVNTGLAGASGAAFQVRGWSASYGNDWLAAFNAYTAGTAGVTWGVSKIGFTATATESPAPATATFASFTTNPNILQGFYVDTRVPEPSTIALGALGLLGAFVIRRRK